MVSTEPTQSSNCGAFCWFCGCESGRVVGTCVKRVNAHVFRMHDSVESERTPTSSLLVAVQNCGLAVTTIFFFYCAYTCSVIEAREFNKSIRGKPWKFWENAHSADY